MRQKKRNTGFMLATLCAFTFVLISCGHSSPGKNRSVQTTSRLALQETPTATMTAAPLGNQVYVGQVPNQNAWIGISTDGKNAQAFVSDGSQSHPATFAQWFKGPVNNGTMDTTSPGKNGQDHLQAMLTGTNASGTVTLASGPSIAFTVNALSAGTATPSATTTATATVPATSTPSGTATPGAGVSPGLYRGTGTFNGDNYAAGWVVLPRTASPSASPTATETTTPSATGTTTPSATETATPSATGTTTPSATGTAAPPATAGQQGGGIVNMKTHQATTAPVLTEQDLRNGSINVPNLGSFKVAECRSGAC